MVAGMIRIPGARGYGSSLRWVLLLVAIGLLFGLTGLVAGVCAVVAPERVPFMGLVEQLGGADTRDLPGDARAFDPFAALPAVADHAGPGARLVSIEVSLVRADGTLDLKASYTPKPSVEYTFAREVPRPGNAPPVGAGGTSNGPWHQEITIRAYEPGQRRQRTTTGGDVSTTVRYTNKGLDRTSSAPSSAPVTFVEAPACSLASLWEVAKTRGAPADAVARITYDAKGYRFSITGTRVSLEFDATCALTRE